MISSKFIVSILIVGICLLGLGLFFDLSNAVKLPQGPIGDPGEELALENYIAWVEARKACGGGACWLDTGDPKLLGRYIGGYLISYRTCDRYEYVEIADEDYMICADTAASDPGERYKGRFSSGFGILIARKAQGSPPNDRRQLSILIPLNAEHTPYEAQLATYNIPKTKLLWTRYDLTNLNAPEPFSGGGFSYEFKELIGGNPGTGNCGDGPEQKIICGDVFLEHVIDISGRGYSWAPAIYE